MPALITTENCEHMMAISLGLKAPLPSSALRKLGIWRTWVMESTVRHCWRAFSRASNSSKASTTPLTAWPEGDVPSYLKTGMLRAFHLRRRGAAGLTPYQREVLFLTYSWSMAASTAVSASMTWLR